MARVPNTNTFALSDVVDVIDDDPGTGSITSVTDNGSGYGRFHTSNTTGLVVKRSVEITDCLTYVGGTVTAISAGSYFDTDEPFVDDDTGIWTAIIDSLRCCFASADAAKFDPRYAGSKDRQSNFRNYGWEANLTLLETDDDGGLYRGLCDSRGRGWIGVCRDITGISTYNITGGSELALLDTQTIKYTLDPGNSKAVNCWFQGDWIFVVGVYSSSICTLFSVPVDVGGNLSAADDEYHFASGSDNRVEWITGDGSKFLFVATQPGSGYPKIHTFSYDGGGNFTLEDTYAYGASGANVYDMWYGYWNSIHFLFVATTAGVQSFSINQSTGELTSIEIDTPGTGFHGIIGNEDDQLLYVSYLTGLAVFSVSDTGYMLLEDSDAQFSTGGARVANDDDGFTFVIGYNTQDRVVIYRIDENTDLVYEGYEAISDATDVLCAYAKAGRLYVTRQGTGISAYGIT